LEKLAIWSGADGARILWKHQKEAIAFSAAYCRITRLSGPPEAGLIKLPTGTGKSGVVAVVSRCLPNIRKVLVLTPREGLVQQMLADVQQRFWNNMAVAPAGDKNWDGPGVEPATIELLLPKASQTSRICAAAKIADRPVLVGTLQALDRLRRDRDRLVRKARTTALDADQLTTLARLDEVLDLLATVDVVLVDEGHYEPAPSWSRSVRSLGRPTLLLSATPFRNDYKLFTVRGAYAYSLPFQRAAEANIVRDIVFSELKAAAGSPTAIDASVRDGDQPLTAQDEAAIATFAKNLQDAAGPLLAGKPAGSKIIVRGASWSALAVLQLLLARDNEKFAVVIHEQAQDKKKKDEHPGRYVTVKSAQAGSPDAIYWLHQTKLLEGIDDASFVAVALLDDFTNDRQLVQQIGRVLRSTDPTRVQRQTATVFARNAEHLSRLKTSWDQYLSFELAGEGNIHSIIPGEAYLPEKIIPQMPVRQYVDGRFRERLPVTEPLRRNDVLLPRRAAIFDVGAEFNDGALKDEAYEGILARNRFVVRTIGDCPPNVWGWTFFTVEESPYLARHFVTEWRFGLTIIVRAGDRLFVFDTDGVPFDPKKVGATRLERSDLVRLFGQSRPGHQVRITKLAASSLDMSDRAIRTMTTSTASFEDTFHRLARRRPIADQRRRLCRGRTPISRTYPIEAFRGHRAAGFGRRLRRLGHRYRCRADDSNRQQSRVRPFRATDLSGRRQSCRAQKHPVGPSAA
jgi:superfamily II DNA or RNA helicase